METAPYTTILFDFDGTLTHSLPVWLQAYQSALSGFGIRLTDDEVMRDCFYRPWDEIISRFNLPPRAEFGDRVLRGVEEYFDQAELFDGVCTVLEECRMNELKLGIVTSSSRSVVTEFLSAKGIADHFGVVVTADDTTNFKPHPEPIFMALSQLQSDPSESLFIGDSSVDMLASRAAGTDSGLFFPDEHFVFYSLDELRAHQPHFVFRSYFELWTKMTGSGSAA